MRRALLPPELHVTGGFFYLGVEDDLALRIPIDQRLKGVIR